MYDLAVIGGGAAGFFTAIQLAERNPGARIIILEKSNKVLSKVRISGGGRCNVTHACFIPQEMVDHYPRGHKELLGPFHRFLCGDMMAWLSEHGVETKIEADGRVFPTSDSSQSIIDCFEGLCEKYKVEINLSSAVKSLSPQEDYWSIETNTEKVDARCVMMATGSTPSMWSVLAHMGYQIIEPVPSLFTFNISHRLLEELPGLSMPEAEVRIKGSKHVASGPLLITHWGLSGPAILKLSAWAARELNECAYDFEIQIDWLGLGTDYVRDGIEHERAKNGKRMVKKYPLFGIPRRLWERFCYMAKVRDLNFASLSSSHIEGLIKVIASCTLPVKGKSTFKDEFVTCGGVDLKQIDFKSMQSRKHDGLYMAGEVINIDAVTGGFNFQAAWTEAFIAAEHIAGRLS
jgi:predicted Rossmann fold flavoprotein